MQAQTKETRPTEPTTPERRRAARILAKSLFKELTAQGYDEKQIVGVATELISEVTKNISSAPGRD